MKSRWGWKLFAVLLALASLATPPRVLAAAPDTRAAAPEDAEDDEFDLDAAFAFHMGPHGGMGRAHGPGMGPAGPGAHMGPRMGHGPGGNVGRAHHALLEKLDLTAAQREKMRAIHGRTRREDIQSRADLQIAVLDLRELMHAERPDRAAIDRQIDKVAQMRAARHKVHAGALLEARALLTPEQQRKLRELQDHPRHGRGPGTDPTRDLESPKR